MADTLSAQLEILRRRIARIDAKYRNLSPRPRPMPRHTQPLPSPHALPAGEEVTTASGRHFQTTRFWRRHCRHGSVEISTLAELPCDWLGPISQGAVPPLEPLRWVYLDTETTGLAGGTGTYAFLIGIGYADREGFHLKQYFLREPGEEASALEALAHDLAAFDVLISYNGKAFDQPLLETRYRLSRMKPPFEKMAHLDLLYGARRLWKLKLESCRLIDLESQILGVERQGDIPGEWIPSLYTQYLRTGDMPSLAPVFEHNAFDILTLACLTAVAPCAFRDPAQANLTSGAEMIGLARWLSQVERWEEAIVWMRRALTFPLSEPLLYRTMWDIAQLERRCGRPGRALELLEELAAVANPFQLAALEELAKHYEHRERNHAQALALTRQALGRVETEGWIRRRQRLERKIAARRPLPLW